MGNQIRTRTFEIPGYALYRPIYAVPFDQLTRRQADENLEHFLRQIPTRLEVLRKAFELTDERQVLDLTESSLVSLSRWFALNVYARDKTEKELFDDREGMPAAFRDEVQQWTLDDITISLCYDVGMYMALVLQRLFAESHWTVVYKPKNEIDYHRPVLESAQGGAQFSPLLILTNIAYGLISGTAQPDKLLEVFGVWKGLFEAC